MEKLTLHDQLTGAGVPDFGATSKTPAESIVIRAKLFALDSAASWLVAEYDQEAGEIYGYVDLFGIGYYGGAEWGYTSLAHLALIFWHGVPRIEFDQHFKPTLFRDCVDEEGRIIV